MASMFSSCGSTSTISMDTLSASAWELEYITGTRIAFEGLFPEKKPTLDFRLGKGVLGGNTGCKDFQPVFQLMVIKLRLMRITQ